jgi:hypothetical protein
MHNAARFRMVVTSCGGSTCIGPTGNCDSVEARDCKKIDGCVAITPHCAHRCEFENTMTACEMKACH